MNSVSSTYCIQPFTIWEDEKHYIVSTVCDPQDKARPLGMFPKTDPNSKIHALLFKQVLFKWKSENKLFR